MALMISENFLKTTFVFWGSFSMKVSLNWLKEYVAIDLEPDVIAEKLTMAGLEVDASEQRFDYLENVVVARVEQVQKHPNADKLSVCRVDAGADEPIQIVCGAPNVREGMFVPCALPGAVLPGEVKIKKGKLRGEVSCGMLCSAAELRLNTDAAGIMDLEGEFVPGTPLATALMLSDTVLEVDLTPNRPDCLSMIGVAREVCAFQTPPAPLRLPDFTLPDEFFCDDSIHDYAAVDIQDPDLCPRYTAGLLFDVKIGPSPFWLQERLESIGLTPINNVVDITNFVMMETGQPLHAFDFDDLAGGRVVVRRAGTDKTFITLDSKPHTLDPDMLMICDGEKPVGLAGVMGGENSEISEKTTRVLVESAYFNPVSIRKTAKQTGISTDASHRFERGVDPEGTLRALNRAVGLMARLCSARIARNVIDEHPGKFHPVHVGLNTDALNNRLGTQLDVDVIAQILESAFFTVEKSGARKLNVGVPSFRVDVSRPEDLSEEVARLWGYNNIQTSYPQVPAKGRPLNPKIPLRGKLRQILTGYSFFEAINYNFIHEESCDRMHLVQEDPRRCMESILNPISDQMSVLRSSLIPGLLETMKKNISQQNNTLRLFEIGKVFYATQKGELPEENEIIAGLITGNRLEQSWYAKKTAYDFFDLKGVVEGMLAALKIENATFEKAPFSDFPYFENGYAAVVKAGGITLGALGRIAAPVLKNFGLKSDAFVFDLSVDALHKERPEAVNAVILPKFPSLSRDITIIVDKSVTVGSVLDLIAGTAKKEALIESVSLFDAFEGEPLAAGKKSLSFRVVYRSSDKTLTEKNVKKLHAGISQAIINEFDADLPD